MTTLKDRIEQRLREIPVSQGGYIALYQQRLSDVISSELISKIAEIAAEEVEKKS